MAGDATGVNRNQLILALDFGGTKLSAGLVRKGERTWIQCKRMASPADPDAETDRKIMTRLIRELLPASEQHTAAIGVSFGGPVDPSQGLVRLSHHVTGWENFPLQKWLHEQCKVPVAVDNDANAAALGEHRFGAGESVRHMIYITISTGVGGGLILNGKLWHGAEGMAGEIGHIVIDPKGPLCLCGKRGCVERLASGPYIAQRTRKWLVEQPDRGRILRELIHHDLNAIDARQVTEAAERGDDLAWESLKIAARAIGMGIGNAANLINPERFVLGGGVTKSGNRFWETIRQTARQTALPEIHLEIVPSKLGDDAPLWGAVALAEDRIKHEYPVTDEQNSRDQ
ncbi:ROK family protein [bacterium]|nr:ROK family protein [bacterium]